MDWISIGLTALAGGLAAGIAFLVVRRPKEKTIAFIATGAVAFAALDGLALRFLSPVLNDWNNARKVEAAFDENPAFEAIRRYEPELYRSIVADVTKAAEGGAGESRVIAMVRGHITGLIQKRLPHASDRAVAAYVAVMVAEMKELNRQNGDLCYRFLFPQRFEPIDGRKYFSAETQAADLAALGEVVRTSAEKPQPIPPEEEVIPALKPIYAELGREHGDDLLLLQSPVASNEEKAKVCSLAVSLYSKILKLPEGESGRILRFMLSRS